MRWTPLPMPADVIARIAILAQHSPVGMTFTNMRNEPYANNADDDSAADSDGDYSDYASDDHDAPSATMMIMTISSQEWTGTAMQTPMKIPITTRSLLQMMAILQMTKLFQMTKTDKRTMSSTTMAMMIMKKQHRSSLPHSRN
jgi:hypothetical protein